MRKNQLLNFVSKSFSALTQVGLTAGGKLFCNKKYTVQKNDPSYSLFKLLLPEKFNNPFVFCGQNPGNM